MKYIIYLLQFLLLFSTACRNNASYNKQDYNHVDEEKVVIEKCPECDGNGYVITYCSECNGNGTLNVTCSGCCGRGYQTHYVSGMRPKKCSFCYGTGKTRCNTCDGNNRCNYCSGHGSFQCTVCKGYGLIIFDIYDKDTWIKCNNCNGTGYEQCIICRGSGKCCACNNGISNCPNCWGSGTYGRESYSETREEECSDCNGFGYHNNTCYKCNGSGKYQMDCDYCNGKGTVVKKYM
ncbi:MAG: hypothetical protein SPJ05_06865 [Candidatus Limisoma sp.]|nr:hypothetical protein [Candidatus Limisoma sp.]